MEVDGEYVRNLKDINEVIELANIEISELKRLSQVLLPCKENREYKLLELDENLLNVINEGTCLSFRGEKNERAVLCTQDRTYEIKEAETSNTLLLVSNAKLGNDIPDADDDDSDKERIAESVRVEGEFHNYYEVLECKPKFGELLMLLGPSAFNGPEYEKHLNPDTLYDWEKLRHGVRASENELREALPKYLIANIDGYFRHISFEYEARSLTLMLDFMDENSWEIDEIDKDATCDALKELIPLPVFDLIFHKYTMPGRRKNESDQILYRYDEEKTCKILAQILLAASPINEYKRFMESWQLGASEKLKPKDAYLSGVAIITWNPQKMRKEVLSYPESKLPENITKRLNELFKVKEKWTIDEITPYISRCATLTADVNALLTKHARSSTINGIKYYCSKYGK